METKTYTVYKFDELSEKGKEKAIEKNRAINVDYEWWDSTYEDAERIGLKITEFDIGRGSYVKGAFTASACEVAQNIFNEHGEQCETYKTAKDFLHDWQPIFNEYMDEKSEHYESAEHEDKIQEIEEEFLKSLCEDYRRMLRDEYEYQTSDEAIAETLRINEYDFTEDGEID